MRIAENTNSLHSMIMQENPITPVVGMKACEVLWTDRYPVTVTKVVSSNEIEVKPNRYIVIDHFAEIYEVHGIDEACPPMTFTRRKNGRWVAKGSGAKHGRSLALNTHNMRIDPSF